MLNNINANETCSIFQLPIIDGFQSVMEEAVQEISNGNLSLRKKAVTDIGLYDQTCTTSEDLDMLATMLSSSWRTVFSDQMVVHHRPRRTFSALLSQCWLYGQYVPYVLQKFNKGQWQILRVREVPNGQFSDSPADTILHWANMPGTIRIYFSSFLLFHLFLATALICLLTKLPILAAATSLISLFFLLDHTKADFRQGLSMSSMKVAALRYVLLVTYFWSHLASGIPQFTLYIPNTQTHD